MSLLSNLISHLGVGDVLPIIEETAITELVHEGEDVIKRKVTIPESAIRAICAKTGADPVVVLAKRDALTQAFVDLIDAAARKPD
jgi:hypothetical protein